MIPPYRAARQHRRLLAARAISALFPRWSSQARAPPEK
jgi:hypothetical protein